MEFGSGGADVTNGETLYVDGKWAGSSSGAVFDVSDPATGEVIGQVSDAGAADAGQALGAAVAAFGGWSRRTLPPWLRPPSPRTSAW